jgi:FkbM family methyltransferase
MIDGQQAWYANEISLTNEIIVDVGANRGALSQFFWAQGKGSNKVISVEPLPQNYKIIRKKIAKSKSKSWSLDACALSGFSGEINMARMHSREFGWNSMDASLSQENTIADIVKINCKTLEKVAPKATVIKMDIEGGEYSVLDHALSSSPLVHTWAVEFHMLPERPLATALARFTEQGFHLIAAGRKKNQPISQWASIPITEQLNWDQIPIAKQSTDGREFKMLHVIARR